MRVRTLVTLTLLLVATSSALFGCTGPNHTLDASAIDGTLQPVLARHDSYVNADASLSPVEKSVALRSSALLRQAQETAMGRAPATSPVLPSSVSPTNH